jgi:cytochrome P450
VGQGGELPDHPGVVGLPLTRKRGHLAFGHWIRTCPGSTLAHLESEIVFSELLRRYGDLRIAVGESEWHANPSVRALRRLFVRSG